MTRWNGWVGGPRRREPDHEIQELQLQAAGLGASNGVTSAHEMSMPHGLGLRDLQVFLGHRERLPMDVSPVVATMDIPQIMDLGLPAIGGDLPLDGSIGARTAAVRSRTPTRTGTVFAITRTTNWSRSSSRVMWPDCRWGSMRSAMGDRTDHQRVGARVCRFRFARAPAFPRASASRRALRDGEHVADRTRRDARTRGVRAAGVRSVLGTPGRVVRRRARMGPRSGDEPVPDDDRSRARGRAPVPTHRSRRSTRCCRSRRVKRITMRRNDCHVSRRSACIHRGGARVGHQEDKKGVLGPGMHADLAAFDTDPMTADTVEGLRPIVTVSLGREVFAR